MANHEKQTAMPPNILGALLLSFLTPTVLRGDLSRTKSAEHDDIGCLSLGYQWSEEKLIKVMNKTISMNKKAFRRGEILAKHSG